MTNLILFLVLFSSEFLLFEKATQSNKATIWEPVQIYCFDCACVNYYAAHDGCQLQPAQTQLGCVSVVGGSCQNACSLVAYPRPAGTQCPLQGFIQ